MIYIARNHCFADGNKRVAWASFCFVLNYYGLTIEATAKEVQSMVIAIVEKKIDNEGFTVWVRDRLVLRCITQDFI